MAAVASLRLASSGLLMVSGVQKATTEVRTTVEATVIRADGKREHLGVISDSTEPVKRRPPMKLNPLHHLFGGKR